MDGSMKEYTENGIRILEPENGLWLTDGETYSQKVYLGRNADASAWTETEWDGTYPDEDEATAGDYETALAEMGVDLHDKG